MKKNSNKIVALGLAISMGLSTSVVMGADNNTSRYFTDVNSENYGWSMEAVDYLCTKGIASGIGNNKYNPSGIIERGDFAVLVNNQFELPNILYYMVSYTDVPSDAYYSQAIINLKGNELVSNIGMFYPEVGITRLDAMKILYGALNLKGYVKGNGSTDLSMYADGDTVTNVTDKIAVGTLTNMGIVNGSDGKILPNSTMNRAEMAVIMYNTLKYMEKIDASNAGDPANTDNKKPEEATEATTEDKTEAVVSEDTVIINQGDSKVYNNANIAVKTDNKNAMLVKGELKMTDSTVGAESLQSNGIVIRDGGKVALSGCGVAAKGTDSIAILADEGGKLELDNSEVVVVEKTSVGVKSYGDIVVKNSQISSRNSEALQLRGKAKAELNGATLTGAGDGVISMYANEKKNKDDKITLDIDSAKLVCSDGTAFYANDAKATINLNGGVTFENCTKLISTGYLYQRQITTGSEVTINLRNGQDVEADIDLDDMSEVTIDIGAGSIFTGLVNKNSSGKKASVYLDKDGVWEFSDTSYLAVIVNEDTNFTNIKDHGHNVYYDESYAENDYLNGDTYSLPMGGELRPL